jgi:hypothetical protein
VLVPLVLHPTESPSPNSHLSLVSPSR